MTPTHTLAGAVSGWLTKHLEMEYVAGSTAGDAASICKKVAAKYGWRSTMAFWNAREDSPELVATRYRQALRAIVSEDLDSHLAIRASSLDYDMEWLGEILDLAREHGVLLHFDSQHPEAATPSLSLLERAVQLYPKLRYTLPARWRRSTADASRLIDLGIGVRVVKGQWPDPDDPGRDPRAGFLELIETLAGRAAHVGIGIHDASLARASLARLQRSGTRCELEQLYGLPAIARDIAGPLGVPVRLYVPYGNGAMPYALSQIAKEPRIAAWFVRDMVLRGPKV
jgi:proline dehydrogenase